MNAIQCQWEVSEKKTVKSQHQDFAEGTFKLVKGTEDSDFTKVTFINVKRLARPLNMILLEPLLGYLGDMFWVLSC